MAMIGKIRRMYFREKKSVREIPRVTSLSRNTIDKWLKVPGDGEPKNQREHWDCKLTPYLDQLRRALNADAYRHKRDRRTGKALFAELQQAGYEGGYSRVTDFVRSWLAGEGSSGAAKAFVPRSFVFGEAFQFDWSEERMIAGLDGGRHHLPRIGGMAWI